MSFKEKDNVWVCFFLKGRMNIFRQILRKPEFIVLTGVIESFFTHEKGLILLSIQIPKWPLRLLIDQEECFKTAELAQEANKKKNSEI